MVGVRIRDTFATIYLTIAVLCAHIGKMNAEYSDEC